MESADTKIVACRVCKADVVVPAGRRRATRCYACGVQAAIDAAISMASRSGPYYERWRANPGGRNSRALPTTPVKPGLVSRET